MCVVFSRVFAVACRKPVVLKFLVPVSALNKSGVSVHPELGSCKPENQKFEVTRCQIVSLRTVRARC